MTKKRLLEREAQFAWIYRKDFPEWGRGRDDAMNLTKYFMLKLPMDDSFGPTDMPSIWNLKKYKPDKGMTMNWAGDSHDAVLGDHRLGARRARRARRRTRTSFLSRSSGCRTICATKPAPKYPFAIDAAQAAAGKRCSTSTARVPRERQNRHAACRSPTSAPIAAGWTHGTRTTRSRRTRS